MKARIAAALFAVATSSSAEDLKEFKFSAPPPVVQNDTPGYLCFQGFQGSRRHGGVCGGSLFGA